VNISGSIEQRLIEFNEVRRLFSSRVFYGLPNNPATPVHEDRSVNQELCTTMTATDVSDTLAMALRSSGLERVRVRHRPRLLSDNGPSYLSAQLGSWLAEHGMTHTRGKPYHPMTQGKIERYHRSMKNQILLENYYLPGQLEQRLAEFVDYYNLRRYHESLDNLTPADVYFGRGQTILTRRENIKLKTIDLRRQLHQQTAA